MPRLASRRIAALGVEDVAALITELRADGRSAKSTANALGTLQGILRFARRRGWVLADPVELLEPDERPRHPRRRQRAGPKTPASVREVPLVEQLSHQLVAHKQASAFAAPGDWVFATSRGTPYGHRNVARRVLTRAAEAAQLNGGGWPPLRFHEYADPLVMPTSLPDPALGAVISA